MAARVETVAGIDGHPVERVILENGRGMRAGILSYGATLQLLTFPAADGETGLVLGFDHPTHYATRAGHLGATAGRFANRIAGGRFELDGKTYDLPRNEGGKHHLHGGPEGFAHRHWQLSVDPLGNSAQLTLSSAAGDMGYPGALDATCTYRLQEDDVLAITMTAVCDAPTPVNLAHHSYWNLNGAGRIYGHLLEVDADQVLEADADTIPSGAFLGVAGTKLDFRSARPIGPEGEPYLDHCLALRPRPGLRFVARLSEPTSGRSMELWTDQPGLQVYSGFKLATTGHGGVAYGPGSGLCLETQLFPNAPNMPHFPDSILRPGETYVHRMEHRFAF